VKTKDETKKLALHHLLQSSCLVPLLPKSKRNAGPTGAAAALRDGVGVTPVQAWL